MSRDGQTTCSMNSLRKDCARRSVGKSNHQTTGESTYGGVPEQALNYSGSRDNQWASKEGPDSTTHRLAPEIKQSRRRDDVDEARMKIEKILLREAKPERQPGFAKQGFASARREHSEDKKRRKKKLINRKHTRVYYHTHVSLCVHRIVSYNTIRYDTIRYDTIRYDTVLTPYSIVTYQGSYGRTGAC